MESGGSALPSPSNGAALGLKKLVLALVLQTISFLKINNNQWFVALMKRRPWAPIFSKIRSLRKKCSKSSSVREPVARICSGTPFSGQPEVADLALDQPKDSNHNLMYIWLSSERARCRPLFLQKPPSFAEEMTLVLLITPCQNLLCCRAWDRRFLDCIQPIGQPDKSLADGR